MYPDDRFIVADHGCLQCQAWQQTFSCIRSMLLHARAHSLINGLTLTPIVCILVWP